MNELAADNWFYTRHGERCGPVSLAGLREFAAAGELDPRLDLVWSQGMAEWRTAGEVDGLFERRQVAGSDAETPVAAASGAVANPYQPPGSGIAAAPLSQDSDWPGARRRMFLIMTVVFPLVWQLGFGFGAGFLAASLGPEIMTILLIVAGLVPIIVSIYYYLARLQNVGMTRWWFLGLFVPLLNLWVGYRALACPAGYAYHKQLDRVGWVLAILYWASILLMVAAVFVMAGLMAGLLDHPEWQEQMREIMRSMPAN